MSTKIVVRHLGNSSLAGQAAEFSGSVVKIGRREGNDIRYDANRDALVSGNHAELRLADGKLVIVDLGSSNGTFVNGTRISAPTPVTARDRISFGQGGPELLISLADAATPDATVVSSAPAFATQASAPVSAGYDLSAPMPAVKPFVGAPIPADLEVPKPAAGPVQRPPSRASQQAHDPNQPKRTIGMNTLMGVLDSERGKERKKILTIVVPIILVLLIPVGWIAYSAWKRENVTTTVQVGGNTDWAPLFAKYDASVYCVMKMRFGSTAEAMGTAWAVAPGKVATNVHVAVAFHELNKEAGEFLFLRRVDSTNDIRIKSVELHPGFAEANRLTMKYMPFDAANAQFLEVLPSADVAIMTVEEADASKLGPPLPLATNAELDAVTTNYEVAYVGYPSEGVPLNAARPTSYQASGKINRILDFERGQVKPADAMYFGHDLSSVGGASGSPIFNKDGKVIALLHAGSVLGKTEVGRIGIAGFNYCIPVSLLHELKDGKAEERQKVRSEAWEKYLHARFESGVKDPVTMLIRLTIDSIKRSKHPLGEEVAPNFLKLVLRDSKPLTAELKAYPIELKEPGFYYFSAVCDKYDANPEFKLALDNGQLVSFLNAMPIGPNTVRLLYYGAEFVEVPGPTKFLFAMKANNVDGNPTATIAVFFVPREPPRN